MSEKVPLYHLKNNLTKNRHHWYIVFKKIFITSQIFYIPASPKEKTSKHRVTQKHLTLLIESNLPMQSPVLKGHPFLVLSQKISNEFDLFQEVTCLKRPLFSSPCQRQCELLPSLGVHRPLTFHILIFSYEISAK